MIDRRGIETGEHALNLNFPKELRIVWTVQQSIFVSFLNFSASFRGRDLEKIFLHRYMCVIFSFNVGPLFEAIVQLHHFCGAPFP